MTSEQRSITIAETLERCRETWGDRCIAKLGERECGGPANQGAHVLPQDTIHLRRYGPEIIHHELNIKPTCGLVHNHMVEINYKSWPLLADRWAAVIQQVIDGELTRDEAKQELALIDAVRSEV